MDAFWRNRFIVVFIYKNQKKIKKTIMIYFKGNNWLQGIAPFKSNSVHSIIIEGVKGDGYTGDIVYIRYFYTLLLVLESLYSIV